MADAAVPDLTPSRRWRILLVEDDQDLVELMSLLLEDAGFAVDTAGNGLEALGRLAEAEPDLILLDLKMPVMNGTEFARVFRERYDLATPIVVVTAADDAQRRAAEVGADGWLGKPFDPEILIETVRQHLRDSSGGDFPVPPHRAKPDEPPPTAR